MLEIIKSLLIAFFAVAVLLPVVRFALRRLSPARHVETLSVEEVKYMQKQELKLLVAYFFFACVLAVFCSGALAMLSSIIHASKEHLFVLTPNFRALFAPGLLLGLTLAALPLRLVQSTLLAQDYDMYKNYVRSLEGHGSTRTYFLLLGLMLLISAVVSWFALQWHVRIDNEKVEITNLLQERRTYTMGQIAGIHFLGEEGEYLISFTDQTNVNTAYLKPVQLEMIALLAERSGHRVIR